MCCGTVCGITLQTWARRSVREQSVEHRAGAQCDLSGEAGSACRLGGGGDKPARLYQVLQHNTNHVQDRACVDSAFWWSCRIVWPFSLVPRNWGIGGGLFSFFV